MNKLQPTQEFERWANGFSGCDGGNIAGPIWFCGIEWGGGDTEKTFQFGDVSKPNAWTDQQREDCFKKKNPYDQRAIKLYASIIRSNEKDYAKLAIEKNVFGTQSDLFKLNLYPISFRHDQDELWEKWLYDQTGLPTKSMYRAWCQANRFQKMKERVQEHKPRLIVCTGYGYLREFIMAFGGVDKSFEPVNEGPIQAESPRPLSWVPINDGRTILVVTPFLGYRKYDLYSDGLLNLFGEKVAIICETHFGRTDWMQK